MMRSCQNKADGVVVVVVVVVIVVSLCVCVCVRSRQGEHQHQRRMMHDGCWCGPKQSWNGTRFRF